ncbi:MAG: MBG domain-containing protein, partial [Clostridia bacterium]
RANYFSYEGNCTVKINKANLTITSDDLSVTYGDEKPQFTMTCAGLVNGEKLADVLDGLVIFSCNYIKDNDITVPYPISAVATSKNYKIIPVEGKLTVIPKKLVITVNSSSIYFGDNSPTYLADFNGFVNNQDASALGKKFSISSNYSKGQSVGAFDIVAKDFENKNYDISAINGTLTVSPKPLDENFIFGLSGNYIYNGAAQNPIFTLTWNNQNLVSSSDYTAVASNNINAGEGKVSITGKGNYCGNIVRAFEIKKSNITVKANLTEVIFKSAMPSFSASVTEGQLAQSDTLSSLDLVFDCAYTSNSSVGDYAINLTLGKNSNSNYLVTCLNGNIKVSAKNIADFIATVNGSYTYSGLEIMPNVNLQWGDIALSLTTDFTVSAKNNINASELAEVTLTGRGNYVGTKTQKFTIKKQPLKITANAQTITYGDVKPSFSAKFIGLVNNETQSNLVGTLNYECSYVAGNAAKTYVITPSGLTSDNYLITFENAILTVNKKDISISCNETNVYNGSVWERSFNSAIGMINGHVFSGTLQTLSAEVGTYTVVGDKLVNFKWKVPYAVTNSLDNVTENYNLHYDISVAISKSDIKFSANGFSGNYDGLPHFGNISTTTPNCTIEYSTDNIEFLSTVPAFINAGNYKVYYKISNSQYNTQTGNYLVVINKAILSISANDCQTVFNSPIPTYSVAYVGLQNNENANIVLGGTLSYSCLYKQGSAVNTYAITPSGLTSDNYTINFVAGALTVSAKNIADFIATVNGSYTYSGLEIMPNVNLQWGDIALSLTTDFTVSAKNNINASELAEVTLTGRGNYVGTKTQKFTIKKQPLKITANAQTITYGDVKPSFSAKFIGLVNNETQSNLVGTLNYECSYVAGNAAKTYVITPSGLTSDNYLITFENAILTVNKKSLKITIDNKTITFNTVAPTYTYIMEGLLPADSINVQLLCGYVKGNNAASYPITAAPITNSNYNISIIDGALLVSPKDVPVVWQSNVFTYNGAIQTVSAYFVDINNQNVALDVTFSGAGAEFKYAGNYIATAVNNLNSSYNLTGNTRNYVIEKRSYTDAEIKVIVAKLLPSGLSATYSPTQKLSMISLPNGFIWNNPNEIPVPNGEYFASYNDDSANNNIYENVKMPIVIAKANATIDNAAKMQSFNYDGNNHSFVLDSIILKFNGEVIATSVAKVVYANGGAPDNAFSAGGTYKTLIKVESALYQGEFSVFVKICSVIIGSGTTFYTIEDAINISKTGETIIVKFNSSFSSDSDVKSSFYNNLSYYTIKNGVKLLVPYDEAATVKTNKFIKEGGVLGTVFRSLTVPSGVNIFVDGEIIVNAQRSHHSTIHMGHTAGDYGLMDVQSGSTIILNSGSVLNCNGYIIGGGNIEALSGSKIYDVLAVKDFRGGKVSSKIFDSMFPFSQYSINNIEINIKINCGAEFSARFGVYTQFSTVIGEMIVVGNGAIFSLSSGYVLKSFDIPSGKMELSLNGNMTTNSTKINIGLGVNIDTANVEFPIPGNFEIKIKSGSTCDINSRFKFLPGSKLTVDEGATLNIGTSGKAYFYGDDGSDKVFAENWSHISYSGAQASGNSRVTYKYLYTDIAQFIVNGSVNVLGAVGGVIKTEGSSGIIVLNNATLTGTTNENAGNVLSPLITVTFTTKGDIGGSGNANLENATYKAQNGKWIKQ